MNDLVTWLRGQLDDDERAARAWLPLGNPTAADREHVARHDPARVLAEVDAKRQVLAEHDIEHAGEPFQYCRVCRDHSRRDAADAPCRTLRLLALPFAGQPGYQERWQP